MPTYAICVIDKMYWSNSKRYFDLLYHIERLSKMQIFGNTSHSYDPNDNIRKHISK